MTDACTDKAEAGASGSSPWRKKAIRLDGPRGESAQLGGELLQLAGGVDKLAVAEVRPPGAAGAVVHPDGTGLGKPFLDTVPRRVAEVEGVADRWIRGAEQQLEEALVARPLDDDADATQPVAEGANAGLERVEPPSTRSGALTAKRKPSGTCAAHVRNCSSEGSRYFVALSSTVGRRAA